LFKESAMKQTKFSTDQACPLALAVICHLAFTGGLLTFAGARAQQRASDDATFRKLIDGYCAAWSSGTPIRQPSIMPRTTASSFTI